MQKRRGSRVLDHKWDIGITASPPGSGTMLEEEAKEEEQKEAYDFIQKSFNEYNRKVAYMNSQQVRKYTGDQVI